MTTAQTKFVATQTTKVDLWLDGRSQTARLETRIWNAFRQLAEDAGRTYANLAKDARKDHNGTLAEAITAYVLKWSKTPIHPTRELWTAALVDAMRPVFKERGHELPANIRATIAFTSQGWKGKARGECWNADMSADGATEIMVHLCETDPVRILNILTHELCHAAQFHRAKLSGKPITKKAGHGKTFAVVAEALDLKPTVKTSPSGKERTVWDHALGDANGLWGAWAKPLLEAAGAMPHAALAEFVKKEKNAAKQSTRMLKFEHQGCEGVEEGAYIWRASGKATADKAKVSCPCCGQRIENPHFEGAEDEEMPERDEKDFADTRTVRKVGKAVKKAVAKRQGDHIEGGFTQRKMLEKAVAEDDFVTARRLRDEIRDARRRGR